MGFLEFKRVSWHDLVPPHFSDEQYWAARFLTVKTSEHWFLKRHLQFWGLAQSLQPARRQDIIRVLPIGKTILKAVLLQLLTRGLDSRNIVNVTVHVEQNKCKKPCWCRTWFTLHLGVGAWALSQTLRKGGPKLAKPKYLRFCWRSGSRPTLGFG